MKTLLQHHYYWRIKCLDDETCQEYKNKLKEIEELAKEYGWRFTMSMDHSDEMSSM